MGGKLKEPGEKVDSRGHVILWILLKGMAVQSEALDGQKHTVKQGQREKLSRRQERVL